MIETFRSLFAPPRHFILIVAALWIGLTLAEKRSERHGITKEQLNNLTFYGMIAYVVGGRLSFVLSNLSAFASSPLGFFSPNPDLFDPTGGSFVAILLGLIYGQRQKLQLWGMLDSLTPICAMLSIGLHLSHLAAGTAFGSPTALPWGMELWNATRHPTQIYELLASLIIFGLIWLPRLDSPPGVLFLNFVALTAGARLFLEAFRGDSTLVFGEFRMAQFLAFLTLAAVFFIGESIRLRQKTK